MMRRLLLGFLMGSNLVALVVKYTVLIISVVIETSSSSRPGISGIK